MPRKLLWTPRDDGHGDIAVWRRPQKGLHYIIGADPAQGRDVADKAKGRTDPDWSCASVHELISGEQVARYRQRSTPLTFADQLDMLGRWYNFAFMVPEVVGHGLGVIESLLKRDKPYPVARFYRKRGYENDLEKENKLHELGFETSRKNRPSLLSNLDRMLKSAQISFRDELMRKEFYSFVIKPDTVEHDINCHDDLVFAIALAAEGMGQAIAVLEAEEAARKQRDEEEGDGESYYGSFANRAKKRGFDRWRPE